MASFQQGDYVKTEFRNEPTGESPRLLAELDAPSATPECLGGLVERLQPSTKSEVATPMATRSSYRVLAHPLK